MTSELAVAGTRRRSARKPSPSRLVLLIGEMPYLVRPLKDEPSARAWAFRLEKPDGTVYDVRPTPGQVACDCPDFLYRRDGLDPKGCKHVRALVDGGLLAPTPVPALTPLAGRR